MKAKHLILGCAALVVLASLVRRVAARDLEPVGNPS